MFILSGNYGDEGFTLLMLLKYDINEVILMKYTVRYACVIIDDGQYMFIHTLEYDNDIHYTEPASGNTSLNIPVKLSE